MKKTKLVLFLLALSMACTKQKTEDVLSSFDDLQGCVEFECVIDNSADVDTKGVDDNIWNNLEEEDGKIALPDELLPNVGEFSLFIDGEYIIPDEELGVQVEGGPTETYSLSGITLEEYNSDLPYLYGGDYSLILTYGDQSQEGYNSPCYYGTCDFTIYGRKSDIKSVTAELSNSIIRGLETTDYFNNYFTSAEFEVTTSLGATLSLTDDGNKTLFFVEAGTELTLSGKAVKTNGYEVTFSGSIGSTEANRCYTIVVDVEDAGGKVINVEFNNDTSLFDVKEVSGELNPDSN